MSANRTTQRRGRFTVTEQPFVFSMTTNKLLPQDQAGVAVFIINYVMGAIMLGSGASANVFLILELPESLGGGQGAVKVGRKGWLQRECEALIMIGKSPFVAKYLAAFRTHDTDYIVFERLGSDLSKELSASREPMAPENVIVVLLCILHGIRDINSHGIVHGDIKPENILRRGEKWVLVDFGNCKLLDICNELYEWCTSFTHTPPEHLPEIVELPEGKAGIGSYKTREPYQPKSDVWSLGVVVFQMMTCEKLPFPSEGETEYEEFVSCTQKIEAIMVDTQPLDEYVEKQQGQRKELASRLRTLCLEHMLVSLPDRSDVHSLIQQVLLLQKWFQSPQSCEVESDTTNHTGSDDVVLHSTEARRCCPCGAPLADHGDCSLEWDCPRIDRL